MKKILFVLTSHSDLGNTGLKTGFWTEELAAPCYALKDKGVAITLCALKGGQPPVDPKSNLPEFQTAATRRMETDEALLQQLANTEKLSTVDVGAFDAVFYPGGHGPLWDLANDADSIRLIADFYNANKPVAFVCHAPGVLKDVRIANGEYLVKGKKVTGFTNTEEAVVELTDVVPFLVEDMLKANGANYHKGADWVPFCVADGLLITGQNPASSESVAQVLFDVVTNSKPDHVDCISPTRVLVHTEIIINAPATKVWSVLRDFQKMPSWSSSLKTMRGDIRNGGTVQIEFAIGNQVLTLTHQLIYREGSAFGWADPVGMVPGLYDHHLYQVEAISDSKTRFVQKDEFVGVNEQMKLSDLGMQILPLYQAFNRELKVRVEEA